MEGGQTVCTCTYCSSYIHAITYWDRHGQNKQQQAEVIGLVPSSPIASSVVEIGKKKRTKRDKHNAGCLRFCGKRKKHDKDYWLKRFLVGIWVVIVIISVYNRYFGDHSSHNVRKLLEKYDDIAIPGVPTAVEHTIRHASATTGWMDNMSLGDWYDSHVPRVNHRYRNLYAAHNISVIEL